MAEPLLDVRGLAVTYAGASAPALAGVDLALAPGERLAIIGESGSGKSTLAMAIAGLTPRTARQAGAVAFPALGHAPRPGRDIGVVFQDPGGSLDPVMSAGDQIAEVVRAHGGGSRSAALARAAELMDRMRIPGGPERLRRFPHEFSGGQRQRIALALALAGDPALLIADEPTSALDSVVQRHIADLLDDLVRERALTLIFVTHDIALASERAGRIAVLHRGRLVEEGPAAVVLAAPRHPYTAALIATHVGLDTPRRARLPEIDPALLGEAPHG